MEWSEDFEAFAAAELPRLLRLGHAVTGSSHDAWDLAQETLVTMGVRWNRIRRHGGAPSYARTTLVRLAIRSSHKRRREAPTPDLDRVDGPAAEPVPGLSTEMTAALNALGARQRTTVVLRHVYDLSLTQIADEMDCSLGTVKSQLSRAEHRLRSELAQALATGADPAAAVPKGDDHV